HVLDAVDLLLDGRGHGIGHHLRVGARIERRDLDGRRRDLGVLCHRQREERDAPRQRDDDRQDRGEDRAVDKEAREHGYPHLCSASSGSSALDCGFPCAISTRRKANRNRSRQRMKGTTLTKILPTRRTTGLAKKRDSATVSIT